MMSARVEGWRRTDTQRTTRWVELSDQARHSTNQKHLPPNQLYPLYIRFRDQAAMPIKQAMGGVKLRV